jgi:hypothetical protein
VNCPPATQSHSAGSRPFDPGPPRPRFDPEVPHPARVYNVWLGGKDGYAADRRVAAEVRAPARSTIYKGGSFLGLIADCVYAGHAVFLRTGRAGCLVMEMAAAVLRSRQGFGWASVA